MVRPEHVTLDASAGDLRCRIQRIQLLGGVVRYTAACAAAAVDVRIETTRALVGIAEGADAYLSIPAADTVLYHR
jgi:hypothetical protein